MTEWKSVRVGEVAQLINGDRGKNYPSARHRTASGIPFINAGHLDGGRVRLDSMDFIPPERYQLLRSGKVEADDVLLCIRGSIGRWALVTPDAVPGAIASSLVILRSGPDVLPQFLAYHIASPEGSRSIMASDNGAAQPNVGAQQVASLSIPLPPLEDQRRIVEVLDSIDGLIENNRRRMEVLEEIARAIYGEWFVKLRYPGHGDMPMVDSTLGQIPEGWRMGTIGDALELKYGKALKADARRGGNVAVVSSAGIVGWHDESVVAGPAVVVGRKGNVGSVHWVDGPCWPIDTTYFVRTDLPLRFVAEQLRRTGFSNSHAAVPGLSREAAYARPFLIPPTTLLDSFQELVDPFGAQVAALSSQGEKLGQLRDLLLPKLVTGQVDVSSFDLDALVFTNSTGEGAVA